MRTVFNAEHNIPCEMRDLWALRPCVFLGHGLFSVHGLRVVVKMLVFKDNTKQKTTTTTSTTTGGSRGGSAPPDIVPGIY